MNIGAMLVSLERERQLLGDFRYLSNQHVILVEDDSPGALEAQHKHQEKRADLMLELSAIEVTLGTWIDQIRYEASVSASVLRELQILNDDIVLLAGQVIDIDKQTGWRIDMTRSDATDRTDGIRTRMLSQQHEKPRGDEASGGLKG